MNNNIVNNTTNITNNTPNSAGGQIPVTPVPMAVVTQQVPQNTAQNVQTQNEKAITPAVIPPQNQTPTVKTAQTAEQQVPVVKRKKPVFVILLLLIIAGLCFYIYLIHTKHQQEITHLNETCTPVSTSGETKELDLNSTIVQDLYNKVKTNIREDLANFELNDEMKLYLAYRQMPTNKIYSSNCNYFDDTKMYVYTCKESLEYRPTAFKENDLMIEVKKLFGETTTVAHDDVQLGGACLGGYQYIAERGEYVEGECSQPTTTTFKADKELIKATSTEATIVLYEKVKFSGTEGKDPPQKLLSGTYKYTFRLDPNYNYVYISKEYEI